jgi:hypothetical protein
MFFCYVIDSCLVSFQAFCAAKAHRPPCLFNDGLEPVVLFPIGAEAFIAVSNPLTRRSPGFEKKSKQGCKLQEKLPVTQ